MISSGPMQIAVLSARGNDALAALPQIDPKIAEFRVAHDTDGCMRLVGISALVLVPPFQQDIVDQVWDTVFSAVRWVHTFSAGVDFIAQLVKRRLIHREDILFTNGRGAFSRCASSAFIP